MVTRPGKAQLVPPKFHLLNKVEWRSPDTCEQWVKLARHHPEPRVKAGTFRQVLAVI